MREIFRLGPDLALIQTVDFMLIVDDPFDFGAIAAANAFSDVYAMGQAADGAEPRRLAPRGTSLGRLGRDPEGCSRGRARGGRRSCRRTLGQGAGALLRPSRLTGTSTPAPRGRNSGRDRGDVLTRRPHSRGEPLAGGSRACHGDDAPAEVAVVHGREIGVSAGTDVTGFGLLGHLLEMAKGSRVVVDLDAWRVPTSSRRRWITRAPETSGGSARTGSTHRRPVRGGRGDHRPLLDLLYDPQTSGALDQRSGKSVRIGFRWRSPRAAFRKPLESAGSAAGRARSA